jgi:hypothetical protein
MTITETPTAQSVSVRSAPAPVAAAGASKVAVVLALLLAAVGVVAVRDAAVGLGWAAGQMWLPAVASGVNGLTPQPWFVPAAAVSIVVGLILVTVAVSPRRRTAVPVRAQTPVYVSVDAVAKLAAARARDVAGVVDARATASRRKVMVRCRVTGDEAAVKRSVADAVTESLSALTRPPRTVVRTRVEES